MPAYLKHAGQTVRDSDWCAKMFMVSTEQINKQYQFAAHTSTAHNKYTDTRIGGNWAINMPPAYTRYADPRQSGLVNPESGSVKPRGMGQFYSEQLDDNSHLIHMCFGVSSFRGMVSFFVGMGSIEAAVYARLGKVPLTFLIGKVAGIYTSMRFLPLLLVGVAGKYLLNRGSSKYYSLRPTMHAYWKRVDFICNVIAVNIGLYQKPDNIDWGGREFERELSDDNVVDPKQYEELVNMAYMAAPEIFKKRGGVDIYQLATRTQRLANARRKVLENYADKITQQSDIYKMMIDFEYKTRMIDKPTDKDSLRGLLDIHNQDYANPQFEEEDFNKKAKQSVDDGAANDYQQKSEETVRTATASNPTTATTNPDGTVTPAAPALKGDDYDGGSLFNYYRRDPTDNNGVVKKDGWLKKWWENLAANYHGAYEWVTFRVQHTGSISSSFSNQSKEADISSMINGFSSQMANARFTFSNGSTGIGFVDAAVSGIGNMLKGYVAGLDAAGVINLAGSAYSDIPEHWEASSSQFPSESFKMELRTPYANKLSRFMDLYIPLAMVMAGSLPISTGRQQYTSPFYCQVISPGRMTCKLGMIEQLSVDVGTGNIGYNQKNQPLGFDVSFTVKDMNKTLHAPIDTGASLLNPLRAIFDDDNAFNDYLNVISALSMADQIIPTRKFSRNVAVRINQWDSFWSMGNWTMGAFDSSLGRGVKNLVTVAGLAGIPGVEIPQLNRTLVR